MGGIFNDNNYYRLVLAGESEGKNLHTILSQYLSATDVKARSALTPKVSGAYRSFISAMASRAASGALSPEKQMLLRFAALSPTLLTPEQAKIIDSAVPEKNTGEPVYYLDEWLRDIARGELALSSDDGVVHPNAAAIPDTDHMQELKSKHSITLENIMGELAVKNHQRQEIENALATHVSSLTRHQILSDMDNYDGPYTEAQLKTVLEINHLLRDLMPLDTEIRTCTERYRLTAAAREKVEHKLSLSADAPPGISTGKAVNEMETVMDLLDMLTGPTGNAFPFLSKEFYQNVTAPGFRETVLDLFAKTEAIDPNVFCRIHKDVKRRIVPEVLLLPSYGEAGICLYALSKSNPVSSRGRLVLPLYPSHLQNAVLAALGGLRWQVAKAKASSYWMSEGLTGDFYAWCLAQKYKGDPEDLFVRAYVNWITKEAIAVQVLDRNLREIFWHHIPFPQNLKEQLAPRNAVYQELLEKLG